jgi:hypothetical protein
MITKHRFAIRVLGLAFVVSLLGAGSRAAADVDLESKPLPRIPPGTVIGKTAPAGWSNFIMMAVPTISKEDLRDAPKLATHYAQMFKFTLLAQTEKSKDGYRLKTLARGFAMSVRGREIIVESKRTFGGDLGAFGSRILADNEKAIDTDFPQVARTPTMIVCDLQAIMRKADDHVRMLLRHAVVVDPDTGKTYTFIWLLSKTRAGYSLAEKEMQFIPENLREERMLSFLRSKFVLGLPTGEAIGLVRTPKGEAVPWTPELEKVAAAKEFTKEQVIELEKGLLAKGRAMTKK